MRQHRREHNNRKKGYNMLTANLYNAYLILHTAWLLLEHNLVYTDTCIHDFLLSILQADWNTLVYLRNLL